MEAAPHPAGEPSKTLVYARLGGQVLLGLGLLLVVLTRGCDTAGDKGVRATQAKAATVVQDFDDKWAGKFSEKELDRALLTDKEEKTDSDRTAIEDIDKKLKEMTKERDKERKKLEATTWRSSASAAKRADSDNAQWTYYRQLAFILGALTLSLGLLLVGLMSVGAERWVALIMLAIVTFALFIFPRSI